MLEHLNFGLFALMSAAPSSPAFALFLSEALAAGGIYVVPVLLLWLWFRGAEPDRSAAVAACVAAALAFACAATLSSLVFHPRPFMVGLALNRLDHAPDSSMPSDHAAVLFAVAFSLALTKSPGWPRLWLLVLLLALGTGWARIYLGIHFPFDVVAAAALGMLAAVAVRSMPGRQCVHVLARLREWSGLIRH